MAVVSMPTKTPVARDAETVRALGDLSDALRPDPEAAKAAVRTSVLLADRLATVALDAARTTTELAARWTEETIGNISRYGVPGSPRDMTKALSDLSAAQGDLATAQAAAFAELARRVQADTLEILAQARRDVGAEAEKALRRKRRGGAS